MVDKYFLTPRNRSNFYIYADEPVFGELFEKYGIISKNSSDSTNPVIFFNDNNYFLPIALIKKYKLYTKINQKKIYSEKNLIKKNRKYIYKRLTLVKNITRIPTL
jgi:hypothetical protein